MALTLTHIPEFVQAIGPSQYVRGYNLAPGVSDYPAGGYPITAASVGLTYLFGAYIVTQNAASQIYLAQFQFTTGFSNTNPQPQATIYLKVLEVNTSSGALPAPAPMPARLASMRSQPSSTAVMELATPNDRL